MFAFSYTGVLVMLFYLPLNIFISFLTFWNPITVVLWVMSGKFVEAEFLTCVFPAELSTLLVLRK